jgi:hypothetical protein
MDKCLSEVKTMEKKKWYAKQIDPRV